MYEEESNQVKRVFSLVLLLTLAASLVFAQGESDKADKGAEDKETLVVAVQSLPLAAISAMAENSNVAQRIGFNVEENLIMTDYYDNYKMKPGLAVSWEMIDDKTLVFQLRKGVKFHNGEEMTAEDVAFTFGMERLMGENAPAKETANPFLGNIESVTALDTYTIEVKSKTVDALLATRFANFPSQIISKKGYEDAASWEEFGKKPVATGPYKVVEYVDDLKVVLERFDEYWGETEGAVERVEFRYVPELSTRIAGLRSGEFDIITEVPPDQAKAIDNMAGVKVVGGPIRSMYGMFFDETNSTPMKDPRVREALTVSVDREKLVRTLFSNYTTVPQNWQLELFGDMFLEDYPGVEYNPERAKALLREAGYNGEKIVYRSLAGYYTLEQTVAEAVTQMWKEVGLNIDLQIKENWSQVTEDTNERNIINASCSAYYPDPVGQFWRRLGINSGLDRGNYWNSSDEIVELSRVLETSFDTEVRRETFAAMLDIFSKDPKGLYFYNLPMIYGVKDSVDWSPLPIEGMDFTVNALKGF
jgi:peptide/nickel transport system substrate-binding protein